MRLVLLHSPYLSPSSWEPTALRLRDQGHAVDVPDLRGSLRKAPCALSFIAAAAAAVDRTPSGPVALVGHSRCGPLLPAVAHHCRRQVTTLFYVDAPLPSPGRSWADGAPPEQVATMRQRSVAGLLPRWSEWWKPSDVERLVPDPEMRARFVDGLPQVPSAFLDERLPDLDWRGKAGYLQLSDAYAAYAATARDFGWPVEKRALDHLAIMTAPTEVALAITAVLNVLGSNSG